MQEEGEGRDDEKNNEEEKGPLEIGLRTTEAAATAAAAVAVPLARPRRSDRQQLAVCFDLSLSTVFASMFADSSRGSNMAGKETEISSVSIGRRCNRHIAESCTS